MRTSILLTICLCLFLAISTFGGRRGNSGVVYVPPPQPAPAPDRMIVLGDDPTNGFQAFPFTSINSLWCRPEGVIQVSHIRISDNQLFNSVVDSAPADFDAACQAWLDYLNGNGPQPPINP